MLKRANAQKFYFKLRAVLACANLPQQLALQFNSLRFRNASAAKGEKTDSQPG